MCEMIRGELPERSDWDRLAAIFQRHGFSPKPADDNQPLSYYITGKSCDCGTALGRQARGEKNEEHQKRKLEDQVRQHKKAGWSESRICRWIAEVSKGPADLRASKSRELKDWLALLQELFNEGRVAMVRLMVYDAGAQVPSSNQTKPVRVSIGSADSGVLSNMADGIWYEFSR